MEPLIVPLRDLDRSSMALAGGKAANLGALLRAGFTVPDGFCLTTAAYRQVVAAGIAPRLAVLLAELDPPDLDRLPAVAAAIRELFYRTPVPEQIAVALLAAARELGAGALAVRSSATAEDLPEASFAGQQESFLNVAGEAALLDAVRRCWASLWTDRAIAYRQRNGIPHAGVALAVVVQHLVPAEVAGVLFTTNPVSGKRTEVAVEASLGLGEAVVSGLVTPDRFVVDKHSMHVVDRIIGSKTVQILGAPGGGTARVTVAESDSRRAALAEDAVIALARIGTQIEAHFGWPQDVEWAIASGITYVLQSRPITSLYPAPPPVPDGGLRVYLSLNAVQGMLEPFTPMGASLLHTVAQTGAAPGAEPAPFLTLGGRIFVDVTDLLRSRLGRMLPYELLPQAEPVAAAIIQRLLADPRLSPQGEPPRSVLIHLVRRHWWAILPIVARIARCVASPGGARRRVAEVIAPRLAIIHAEAYRPGAPDEPSTVVERIVRRAFARQFRPEFFPLVASGMLCYKLAEALVRKWGLDARLLARARQGLPHNKTTAMDLDLWALARMVRSDPPSCETILGEDPDGLAARYRAGMLPPIAQQGMAGFLAGYGHRAIREIDVGMPRWGEAPGYLFGVLKSYLRIEDPEAEPDRHFARQAAAGEEAVAALVAEARRQRGGRLKAMLLGFFLRRYRQLGGLRETPKFYAVWMFQALHDLLLAAGKQLAARGIIDRPEDIFFLRLEELERRSTDVGAGVPAGPGRPVGRRVASEGHWRELIAARRRDYERELARPRAPRVLTSEGEAFYGEAIKDAAGALAGTGASPGVARGRAHVIRDPVGAHLQPGEILVAPSTDPAWTPLFLAAGGLVMEAGGMMSHGAVVAREYGIPAVVGVAEATIHLATGQGVEVDGDKGLVKPLND